MRSKILAAVLLTFVLVGAPLADDKLPKNAVLIGEATVIIGNGSRLVLSLVDLDNRELVLAYYGISGRLEEMKRTGITVDLDKQSKVSGGAAPARAEPSP